MRLIDANALIKVIQQNDYMLTAKHNSMAPGMFTSGIRQAVDESQTIDPVRHGKWLSVCGCIVRCDLCRNESAGETNYCPNCGAKMDLDGKDEDNV